MSLTSFEFLFFLTGLGAGRIYRTKTQITINAVHKDYSIIND